MNANLFRATIVGATGAVLAAMAASAIAGSKLATDGHVRIVKASDGSGSASGLLGYIYNGSGSIEYIGCQVEKTSSSTTVLCHARIESGDRAACLSSSSFLAQSVAALPSDAKLTFAWNAQGTCTSVNVYASSTLEPKAD